MNDHDSESEFLEIMFMLKAFVGGNQNVALALGLGKQFGVRQGAPFGFCDGQDFMIGESLAETRINALI